MSGWPEGLVDGFHAGGAVADPYECLSPGWRDVERDGGLRDFSREFLFFFSVLR